MDGISRCLSSPVPFAVGAVHGLFRPLTLARLGQCEAFLLSKRKTVLDSVEQSVAAIDMHPASAAKLLEKVYAEVKADKAIRYVTYKEMHEWLNSYQGCYYTAWLCLRKDFPQFATVASSREFFAKTDKDFIASFLAARHKSSGTDAISTMEWPANDSGLPDKFIPWRRIFRSLAMEYGWGPKKVGKLTLWSLQVYTADEKNLGGTQKLSGEAAREHAMSNRQAKKLMR